MRKDIVIDGNNFSTLAEFYEEAQRKLCPAFQGFGRNLDAFNDIMRGGFGLFESGEPIRLVWVNSKKSRVDLGPPETLKWLAEKITRCHPSNVPHVEQEINLLKADLGRTLFLILVDIIVCHEHVELLLQ